MSNWGTNIKSNELSLEIREAFLDKLDSGVSPEEATEQLLDSYLDDDSYDTLYYAVFYISLAAVQLEVGQLTEIVKEETLHYIDSVDTIENLKEDEDSDELLEKIELIKKLLF